MPHGDYQRRLQEYLASTEHDLSRRMFAVHAGKPAEKSVDPINPEAEKLDNSTPAGVRAMELAFRGL